MPTKKLPKGNWFSCEMLAAHFVLEGKRVRSLCALGQLPNAKKWGRVWLVSREAARFLGDWLKRDPALPHVAMRQHAARIDPTVLDRQPESMPVPERLTDKAVRDIRQRVAKGQSLSTLGIKYKRDNSAISRIGRRLRYADVV